LEDVVVNTPETVSIRPLATSDADAIRDLNDRILGRDRSGTWDTYVDRFLKSSRMTAFTLPTWGSQVAELDGAVVGFVLAERQSSGYGLPPGMRIVALAVDPQHRRRGIGRQLIEALKTECKRQGIRQMFSILNESDQRDAAFLERCGFDPARLKVFVADV
jgi:ribosomal protein S18 acetylase RimI-like enzyme